MAKDKIYRQNSGAKAPRLMKLKNDFQLIDMERGCFIARFYTKDEYLRVLEE